MTPYASRRVRPLAAAIALFAVLISAYLPSAASPAHAAGAAVYWGAYIKGTTYGFADAPFDERTIDAFEAHAGKRVAIVHWGQPWYWTDHSGYQGFQADMAERVRLRGAIPMITWTSEDLAKGGATDQPAFQLAAITAGAHDAYIRQWARAVKAWGYPLFVRFDHEMNGTWFNWSERKNGNLAGQFIPMWQHVVDIFAQEGAANVTWVWAPNKVDATSIPLGSLYPGTRYVDWIGLSAYNWGTNPAKPNGVWVSLKAAGKPSYDAFQQLAPTKPILIAETASTEYGGSKAAWITDALATQLPATFPNIKAVVWFNWNCKATNGNMDWVIESSASAQTAFATSISSAYYATNTFAALPRLTKLQPLTPVTLAPVNTLVNGSFEATGTAPWYAPWTTRNDLGATFTQDGGTVADGSRALKVTVTTANVAQPWVVQVRQGNQTLVAGKSYTLRFSAKAATGGRPIDAVVQKIGTPYTVFATKPISLTTGWTTYTVSFTAPATDTANVLFNFAKATGTVWIDNVAFTAP